VFLVIDYISVLVVSIVSLVSATCADSHVQILCLFITARICRIVKWPSTVQTYNQTIEKVASWNDLIWCQSINHVCVEFMLFTCGWISCSSFAVDFRYFVKLFCHSVFLFIVCRRCENTIYEQTQP